MSVASDTGYEDTADFVPDNSVEGGINPLTGLLSKAIDTAIDVGGKAIGSKYATGQVDPATLASQKAAAAQQANATNTKVASTIANYTPQILLGVGVLAVVAIIVVIAKK